MCTILWSRRDTSRLLLCEKSATDSTKIRPPSWFETSTRSRLHEWQCWNAWRFWRTSTSWGTLGLETSASRCRFARVASSETQGAGNRSGGSQTGESGENESLPVYSSSWPDHLLIRLCLRRGRIRPAWVKYTELSTENSGRLYNLGKVKECAKKNCAKNIYA